MELRLLHILYVSSRIMAVREV